MLTAFAISSVGDWLYAVALVVLVVDLTGSPGWIAAVTVSRMLAYIFLAPVGGAMADRYDRRRLMVTFDLVRAVLMMGLAFIAFTDGPVVVALVLATLTSAAAQPYSPAARATTPELVPEGDLAAANAAESIVGQVAAFLGPALGAALVAVSNTGPAFVFNAVTFVVSASMVVGLGYLGGGRAGVAEPSAAAPTILKDIAEGMGAVKTDPGLVALLLIGMAQAFFYGVEIVAHVLVAEDRLGMGPDGVGLLVAALGVGGILMAPFTAKMGAGRRAGTILWASSVLTALPMLALAVLSSPALAVAVLVVEGAMLVVFEVVHVTILQRAAPADVLGRVFGLLDSAGAFAQMAGALAVPVLVGALSLEWALVIGASVLIAASLGSVPSLHRLVARTEADRQRLLPVVERFRRLGIFGEASQVAVERIAKGAAPVAVAAGDAVFLEGEPADRLYVITAGTFAVEREGVGELARLGEDEWFGEVGVIRKAPRNATVRCVEDGELLAVGGDGFLDALTSTEILPDPLHRSLLTRTHDVAVSEAPHLG